MSVPARQLRDLSLDESLMPMTRAQSGHRVQQQADDDSSEDDSVASSEDDGPPSTVSIVQARSGFDYDNRYISAESWQRAKGGLTDDFDIKYCIEFSSGHDGYYAFRMTPVETQFGIRIGAPNTDYDVPTCSCEDFQRRHLACKHLFWLTDQLTKVIVEEEPGEPLHLQDDGSILQSDSPFQQISKRGLKTLADDLGWRFQSQPSRTPNDDIFSRKDQIRDILSTFGPSEVLPEDYLADVYEDISEESRSIVEPVSFENPDKLETVIFRLAMSDEGFFRPLREAVDGDHCASAYFSKLGAKADELFARLENLSAQYGHTDSSQIDSISSAIRQIVRKARKNLELRAPLGEKIQAQALRLLLSILNRVCDNPQNPAPDPKGPADVSNPGLMTVLLTRPRQQDRRSPPSPKFAESDTGQFIIDALWDLKHVARDFSTMLEDILRTVVQNGAPPAYVAELRRFIDHIDGGDEPTSAVGQKRTALGDDRGKQKRMK